MKEWSESRLKNLLAIPLSYGLNVSSEDDREDWPRYIRITDFDDFDHLNEGTFKSLPMFIAEPALLKDGDLLFARSGATAGKTFLYSTLPNGACYAGYLIRARFKKNLVNPKFVSYFTKGVDYCNWKNRYCIQTTIQNISADKYNQLPINIPSLSEQQRIVDYLDEKLAKIDERIKVLEKQKDAYARLKKSIIHQAVTRGLNPNVSFKDSGVEWIGMIPEHWEVKRFKEFASTTKGKQCDYHDSLGNNMAVVLTVETLRQDIPSFYNYGVVEDKRQLCNETDIVVIWDGAGVGEFLKAKKGMLSSTIARIDVNDHIVLNRYLWQWRYNIEYRLKHVPAGMGIPHLGPNFLNNYLIPIPPLSEQLTIANYLDEKCSKIDAATENIGKQIDALKRLKRALINEVVTGQRAV